MAFAYDSSGNLRLHGRMYCFRWSNDEVEVIAIEDTTDFKAYPISTPGTSVTDRTHILWDLGWRHLGDMGRPHSGKHRELSQWQSVSWL
ncbi:MAG: hypothetical protein R3C68_09995 [Myxococcota bacterium]